MTEPTREGDDPRPDIQQAVEARSDAADAAAATSARGKPTTPEGVGGEGGAGGVVKNQDADQQ